MVLQSSGQHTRKHEPQTVDCRLHLRHPRSCIDAEIHTLEDESAIAVPHGDLRV